MLTLCMLAASSSQLSSAFSRLLVQQTAGRFCCVSVALGRSPQQPAAMQQSMHQLPCQELSRMSSSCLPGACGLQYARSTRACPLPANSTAQMSSAVLDTTAGAGSMPGGLSRCQRGHLLFGSSRISMQQPPSVQLSRGVCAGSMCRHHQHCHEQQLHQQQSHCLNPPLLSSSSSNNNTSRAVRRPSIQCMAAGARRRYQHASAADPFRPPEQQGADKGGPTPPAAAAAAEAASSQLFGSEAWGLGGVAQHTQPLDGGGVMVPVTVSVEPAEQHSSSSPGAADSAAAAAPDNTQQQGEPPTQPPASGIVVPQWLQQQQQEQQLLQQCYNLPQEVVLIGIDPDTNGAIAVVRSQLAWSTTNSNGSGTGTDSSAKATTNGSSSRSRQRQGARSTGEGNNASNCTTSSGSSSSTSTSTDSINTSTTNGSSNSNSTAEVPQLEAYLRLPAAAVAVYDMPVETIVTKSKTSTGKLRVRR